MHFATPNIFFAYYAPHISRACTAQTRAEGGHILQMRNRAPYFPRMCPARWVLSLRTRHLFCALVGPAACPQPHIIYALRHLVPGGCCLCAQATCSVPEARASGVHLGLRPPHTHITRPRIFPALRAPYFPRMCPARWVLSLRTRHLFCALVGPAACPRPESLGGGASRFR